MDPLKNHFLSHLEPASRGIAVVDKPAGVTSHDVVAWARKITLVKRVGHAGTLDPLASGVLIILIGRQFTRLQSQFLKQDKTYLCQARFGYVSDTYDSQGQVIKFTGKKRELTKADLKLATKALVGEISQRVPAFSAVKRRGQKLYELARKQELDLDQLPIKQVVVKRFEVTRLWNDQTSGDIMAEFVIECGSGTYVRSLIHDLGQAMGVGAVVSQLRRIQSGNINIDQASICPFFKNRHSVAMNFS